MELRQYAYVLRAHWLLIALSVAAGMLAAGVIAWTRAPTYAADTRLFVSTGIPVDVGDAYQASLFAQQRVLSYAQILDSPSVARGVIRRLGLQRSVEELQAQITTSVPPNTVLINVTVKERSARQAKAIADAVAAEFSRFVNTLEAPPGDARSPVKVSVTSPARVPAGPVSPQKRVYVVLGFLVGLVLGIGAAVLREAFDTRIRDSDDAVAVTGAPVLGGIVEDRDAVKHPLTVLSGTTSAEAFRTLRTNLDVLNVDRRLRSFVVSSAVASEGKTHVVANLGISLAQAGRSVILVDANLRRPRLAQLLGLSPSLGLTHLLEEHAPPYTFALEEWSSDLPLEVLGSGPQPPNPTELLDSDAFRDLLGLLTVRAEFVIVDAPPLLALTDATIVARATSGVLLVTRVGSTTRDELELAMDSVNAVRAQLLGVVLNRLPVRRWIWRRPVYTSTPGPRTRSHVTAPEFGAAVGRPPPQQPHET
jgi:succinoglycan biosynthesis transport protein ExoP